MFKFFDPPYPTLVRYYLHCNNNLIASLSLSLLLTSAAIIILIAIILFGLSRRAYVLDLFDIQQQQQRRHILHRLFHHYHPQTSKIMVDPLKIFWVLTNSTYLVTKFIRTGTADKSDFPLYFEKGVYEIEVDENADINQTVLQVIARNHDDSPNIRYKITGGNIGNVFGIRNSTGEIYVARSLDYETLKKYELKVEATDSRKENFTTIIIHVKDTNDNPPIFDKTSYRTQITEEDDRGLPKKVLKVTATDADIDRPSNIMYFLTGPGIDPENPADSNFDINKATGEIFVLKALNRDPPHGRPQWKFTVFAQDEGGEGLVGFAEVTITLKDINDNAPTFSQGIYYGNVSENGTAGIAVMRMKADDFDDPNEGLNAKVIYSIEKNAIEEDTGAPIFTIDKNSGLITTAVCCLDREKTPDYSLQIVATDGGGHKGTGTASIRVKDLNDMPPHFTKEEWHVEVEETEAGKIPENPILTVTVNDEDEVNDFQYKVMPNSGYGADKFTMIKNNDGTGSLKLVQPLDFEDPMQINGFRFRIQVIDSAGITDSNKYHVAHSWVIVKLKDINDNAPRFKKANLETTVNEDAPVGKLLGTFKAFDIDNAGKGKITYSINRATDRQRQFVISKDGNISIQRQLDRETMPKHYLEILATDDGVPPKTATASMTVNVKDVNDNAPRFSEDYRPIVMENEPPRKIAEVYAVDDDDPQKGNGQPFQFRLDPTADDMIRSSFRVEQDQQAAKGEGKAIVSTLRSFDREIQKEYHVPIVIKDSGNPAMTGTSTLTVVIGDVNDNHMVFGSTEINIYNYQGQTPDTPIGRIFVNDKDDWDLNDKRFYWDDGENPRFILNENTGMITMRRGAREGRYLLKFKVQDRKHMQYVMANVTINVENVNYETIKNSGSIRITGTTAEEFINVWNTKAETFVRSKLDLFREKTASLLSVDKKNVIVFSVQAKQVHPPVTDVRFAARTNYYFKPVRLNGLMMLFKRDIERDVGITIAMVNIDECIYENANCSGSCTTNEQIHPMPYLVNSNRTALVGIRITTEIDCRCGARNFNKTETCKTYPCYNGGRCLETRTGVKCTCPRGYSGPKCQQTIRSFRGNGWAWYPSLDMCDNSHLSIEFITRKSDGILLYNGPITPAAKDEFENTDFIALELENANPRLLIDYGSGTLELKVKTKLPLNNGEWHHIDIFWDAEDVRMVVDHCRTAEVMEYEEGSIPDFETANCMATGKIPVFNEYLNVNTPLQLGGVFREKFDYTHSKWQYMPIGTGFDGCIRNLRHNGIIYDLAHPGLNRNSFPGCPQVEDTCNLSEQTQKCMEHGTCIGNLNEAKCECAPGWTGQLCNFPTTPASFRQQSYVKYALSFEPDKYTSEIQLRFRTREKYGELFRVSDQHNKEYGILDITNGHLRFRYNLNSNDTTDEHEVSLMAANVDDGQWHLIKASRYGASALLELDGGEGRNYNDSYTFEAGHQWLSIDKQEGVYAGGKVEVTGVKSFEVHGDFHNSCIDDLRYNGKSLPLPPGSNGTQYAQATAAKNLDRYCLSNNPCANSFCMDPFVCVDVWNKFECTCGEGLVMSGDNRGCIDRNECLEFPCLNGGTCYNKEPRLRYTCACPDSYYGDHCEFIREQQALKLSTSALASVVACLVVIIILLFIYFACSRRRPSQFKKPPTKDDIRENIINYCDEGGGENDMTSFDMKTLKVPLGQLPELVQHKVPVTRPDIAVVSDKIGNVDIFIEERKRRTDIEMAGSTAVPYDDLRNYAYEGGGTSTAGTTDDGSQDFKFLTSWGPSFDKISQLYTAASSNQSTATSCSSVAEPMTTTTSTSILTQDIIVIGV